MTHHEATGVKEPMLGAIAGDIIGSVHEGTLIKRKDFPCSSRSRVLPTTLS